MTDKYCTIKDLVSAFTNAGRPVSDSWIHRQERKGNLKFQRSTTDIKKPQGFLSSRRIGAVRIIRKSQIKEIVQAFLPGGIGYWSFEGNRHVFDLGYPKLLLMKLDPNKYYTIRYLMETFAKVGMPRSEHWIRIQEAKGNLKLPRSTTDIKKPKGFLSDSKMGAVRLITGKQIGAIVKAFLPGGIGYWSFEEKNQ